MKACQMMEKDFVYVSKDDTIVDVSIKMEETKRFTLPILDESMKLEGWATSLDITKGLREGKKTMSEIMHTIDEIKVVHKDAPAKNVVTDTSEFKLINLPIIDDNEKVIGVVRPFDIIDTMSDLYDIKVYKIYEAMESQLKGITWDELMEASAKVSTRTTGVPITAEQYENNIRKSTFGDAIWATGGLESFFAGLISVGELVIAQKVGNARK
ncbi:MAG: CBS domain-containing protein [archaeon]|nr:CBS domain-containing protein [archaeon]